LTCLAKPFTQNRTLILANLFLCYLLLSGYYENNGHDPDKKAILLNNQASELYRNDKIDSAIILLNKAIEVDSLYGLAHFNICNFLSELQKYNEALTYAKHYFIIDFNNGAMVLGMTLEKMNLIDSAKYFYKKLLNNYEKLRIDSLDYMSKVNIAFITTIAGDKAKGLIIINNVLAENKSLPELKLEFVKSFRNEIESYQEGGFLEISKDKGSKYWIASDKDFDEMRKYLLDNGINADMISASGGYRLSIRNKFRDKALKLGIVERKEK
jgi:hypothetical protein